MSRIAVVGAGLAGLSAARELAVAGHEVVVLEKSRGLGGRLATRRVEGGVLDHGCPVIEAPADGPLARAIEDLGLDDIVRLPEPRAGVTAIGFAAGQTRLAKALADGVDVRRGVRVSALRRVAGGVEIADEQGNGHGLAAAAIVTAPGPQAAALLEASGEVARAAAVAQAEYDAAVCVLTEVEGDPEDPRPVIPAAPPLAAISLEWRKRPGPRAVVARLDGPTSASLIDAPDGDVLDVVLPLVGAMLGLRPVPWTQVKRWRYALPVGRLDPSIAVAQGSPIVLAGDVFVGLDLEGVWRSGVDAARLAARTL